MSRHDDLVYVGHMLDAAETVLKWTHARDWASFAEDDLLQSAAAYQIQIIDEAASRLSPSFRGAHAQIPWRKMTDMRNILVHNYRRVARVIMWQVISEDLPVLIAELRRLLPPE